MPFATNFDKYLARGLSDEQGEASEYEWKTGWCPDHDERWKVDVAGVPKKSGRPIVLIEVELRKDNPAENVVKVWRWAKEKKPLERFLFLQVFSANYVKMRPFAKPPTKVTRREHSVFVGEQMKKDREVKIDYAWRPMKFRPPVGKPSKVGGGRMRIAAEDLAREIAGVLQPKQVTKKTKSK